MSRHRYGRAYPMNAFQTLGQGLRGIGETLGSQRDERAELERETAREDRLMDLKLLSLGGGPGAMPVDADPGRFVEAGGPDDLFHIESPGFLRDEARQHDVEDRPIGPYSPEGIEAQKDLILYRSENPVDRASMPTLPQASAYLDTLYGTYDPKLETIVFDQPLATTKWQIEQIQAIREGRDPVAPPLLTLPPIEAGPPVAEETATEEEGGFLSGIGRLLRYMRPGATEVGGRLLDRPEVETPALEPPAGPSIIEGRVAADTEALAPSAPAVPAPVTVAPARTGRGQRSSRRDSVDARARELQAEGKSRQEIMDILQREGFNVRR